METVRLLYPDWLIVAVIAFLFFLAFIGVIFYCFSIKIIQAIDNTPSDETSYYIKDIDGNNLINIEEIEQITQRYNNSLEQYEIVYFIKSGHEIKEVFENGSECRDRFNKIYKILNS